MANIEQAPCDERILNGRTISAVAGAIFLGLALNIGMDKKGGHSSGRSCDDEPRVVYKESDGPYKILLYPGSCTNVEAIQDHAAKIFGDLGSLYIVDYSRYRFDEDELKPAIINALDAHASHDANKELITVSHSIGNPVEDTLLLDSDFRNRIGKVKRKIREAPFRDLEDLRAAAKFAAKFGARKRPTRATRFVYRQVMRRVAMGDLAHSDFITSEDAKNHLMSTAETPLEARLAQCAFILDRMRLRDGCLIEAGHQTEEIYTIASPYDSVVDHEAAPVGTSLSYGRHVLNILHGSRPHGNHGGLFEWPEAPRDAILGKFSEQYHAGERQVEIPASIASEATKYLRGRDSTHKLSVAQ